MTKSLELNSSDFQSWGRFPIAEHAVVKPGWVREIDIRLIKGSILPYGNGRSYGDCCINNGGSIVATSNLSHLISFDPVSGILRAESGILLRDILRFAVPRGWFLPVTPGTQFVSLGGAIANDVHGKNHHRAGTFGSHVEELTLLRSDQGKVSCSKDINSGLFKATIGGLGLTGLITEAALRLMKVPSAFIDVEAIKFSALDEFFEISRDSEREFEYTVAWLDCLASGRSFGRGIFLRGNHAATTEPYLNPSPSPKLFAPIEAPGWVLNPLSVRAFNFAYYNKQFSRTVSFRSRYEPFFYPLDAVNNWNRIYGKRGFFQFQCVVPQDNGNRAIREILEFIVKSGKASFLAVLKEFGDIASPGLLSFPRCGVTLCLDFPNDGSKSLDFMRQLDQMTAERGGAIYPAKDVAMSPHNFSMYYKELGYFKNFIDPGFSSSFWRRVMGDSIK